MTAEYIRNWIKKAGNDIKIIEHELELPEPEWITDVICFHCQQAATFNIRLNITDIALY